ncbi:hypothetical protein QJS10_CPB20g01511 [Acorus calamus]|uniref:Uncharacterized protein n=1 Tax=Acorus calamus TaxID=4465 RepID=A0AAV9CE25_ACOCL|nr:hypothetical protein QJS10_CPB20g01511 [Acorus calamus]
MEQASPLATQRRLQIHFPKIPFAFSPLPRHSILLPLRPSHTPRAESERDQNADASIIASDAPPKRPPEGKGLGFGKVTAEVKKRKGKERRSNIVRRSPVEKPTGFFSGEGQPSDRNQEQQQQLSLNENAFLLTWLGLGALILVEGIALAASEARVEFGSSIQSEGVLTNVVKPLGVPTNGKTKGTGLTESVGKEDHVELDSSPTL